MAKNKSKGHDSVDVAQNPVDAPPPDGLTHRGRLYAVSAHVDNPANFNTQDNTSLNLSTLMISKPKARFDVVKAWNDYFGEGNLDDWARFCRDLGLEGDFSSKKKCKKAMKSVWINIHDFLQVSDKSEVTRFPSEAALSAYTLGTRKMYPRSRIQGDSPLKLLLANILYPRRWMGPKKKVARA